MLLIVASGRPGRLRSLAKMADHAGVALRTVPTQTQSRQQAPAVGMAPKLRLYLIVQVHSELPYPIGLVVRDRELIDEGT